MTSKKCLGILFSTPYGSEGTDTRIKIAEAAGDGVHGFATGQEAKGIPNAEQNINRLIDNGLGKVTPMETEEYRMEPTISEQLV